MLGLKLTALFEYIPMFFFLLISKPDRQNNQSLHFRFYERENFGRSKRAFKYMFQIEIESDSFESNLQFKK